MSAQINQLNTALKLLASDNTVIYSSENGDTRKTSLGALSDYFSKNSTAKSNIDKQFSAPASASTLLVDDKQKNIWLILTPLATLAALTIKFPLVANTTDMQELLINTTQTITALTLNANGASIIGAPTTLLANGFISFRYDAIMQTWYRIG